MKIRRSSSSSSSSSIVSSSPPLLFTPPSVLPAAAAAAGGKENLVRTFFRCGTLLKRCRNHRGELVGRSDAGTNQKAS